MPRFEMKEFRRQMTSYAGLSLIVGNTEIEPILSTASGETPPVQPRKRTVGRLRERKGEKIMSGSSGVSVDM